MLAGFLGIVWFFTDGSSTLGLVPGDNRRSFRTFFGLTLNASLTQTFSQHVAKVDVACDSVDIRKSHGTP